MGGSERGIDGRWLLLGLLVPFWLTYVGLCRAYDEAVAERLTGVPAMGFYFGDLRVILAGMESYREGYDPLVENPNDPWWGRPMNYPRVWLLLEPLGWDRRDAIALGTMLGLAFYATFFAWVGRLTSRQGLVVAAALFSAPHEMAVLRGNNDLILFVLLAAGALALRLRPALRPHFYLYLFPLAVLKYYPIFGLTAAGRDRSARGLACAAAAFALFAGWMVATAREVRQVSEATPRPYVNGYGRMVGPIFARIKVRENYNIDIPHDLLEASSFLACALVLGAAWWRSGRLAGAAAGSERADDFLVGAGVFTASFLFGNNYNYRLIYLLFLFPQALRWAGQRGPIRWYARALLAAILASLWGEYPLRLWRSDEAVAAEQVGLWFVFALTALLTFALWRSAGPLLAGRPASGAVSRFPCPDV